MHWPGVTGLEPTNPLHAKYRSQTWAVLEEFYYSGKFKSIGVSNYTANHLLELLGSCRMPPAVLQMECHPKHTQEHLRDICKKAGVHFQAYSSLGKGALLQDPEVCYVAENCGRTPTQVLLRWAVQQGISVLPRSSHPQHIEENSGIFEFVLSDKDMQRLFALNCDTGYCSRDSSFIR